MKSFSVLALAVSLVAAVPLTSRTPQIDDTTILQFALTLEHIENTFYTQGLARYDEKAFESEGYDKFVRGRIQQIGEHEQAHVKFLEGQIGKDAVKPCEYDFTHNSVAQFLELAGAFEGVGAAAYSGSAQFVDNKQILSAAASILGTEGRHAAWISSAAEKEQPWNGGFETLLGITQVFSIASEFIKSCPEGNFDLGLTAFADLTLSPPNPSGQSVKVSYNTKSADDKKGPLFLVFLTGFGPYAVPIKDGKADAPKGLQGTVYAIVTNSDKDFSDKATIAGPVILQYPFSSSVSNAPQADN